MYDIVVIGGGASGLAAALAAAERAKGAGLPLKVAVLEKNPRVGKKLLMTGNGRCNLTNLHAEPERYHGDTQAAAEIFRRFPPERVVGVFRAHGLLCRALDGGRVYPYSLQASSVLNILRLGLEAAGVETVCDFPVQRIENISGGFAAVSAKNAVKARKVVVAAGGRACPQSGSDGDGYGLLRPFRHTVTPLCPALVQVRTDVKRVRPLKGVRCMASASLLLDGKTLKTVRGEVQFTENSLSGICVFELSRCVGESGAKTMEIALDLAPEYGADELASLLSAQAKLCGEMPAASITEGILNKALGAEVTKAALEGAAAPAGSLTAEDIRNIAGVMKRFRFPVQGTLSWQNAQVTAGGVPLAEVDKELQSRFCRGIYLCGEILNIDGDCGGFNLHWAWASGIAAGIAAAGC
jgi:predicted Rossmann fold flavoprotein